MPSTYSPNLRIELIASGEQGNTWGGTTNNNLGTLIENAISGTVVIDSMPSNTYTLTVLNGANDNARNMYIRVSNSTTLTAAGTIIAPSVSKMYVVTNSSLGGFAINLKTSASTGISIPNGATRTVFYDGTDFVDTVTATKSLLLNADATQNLQATTFQQLNTGLGTKLSRDGSLPMTGLLTLSTSSLSPSAAATTAAPKGYVDLFVPLAGNAVAMTGALTLYATDPVGYQATSKNYTDSFYVAKSGGTMTGALTLYSSLPTTSWQAVPKQYVDNIAVTAGPGISITGSIAANNVAVNILYATTSTIGGVKVDGTSITINGSGVISAATGGGGTVNSVGVTTSNGFAGSSSGGSTPQLTLSTTVNGILKGSGSVGSPSGVAAATALEIVGAIGSTSVQNATNAASVPWSGVSSKPADYPGGCTGAAATASSVAWANITSKPANYPGGCTGTAASAGSASSVPWSGVSGTPTTLGGYGITDAVAISGATMSGRLTAAGFTSSPVGSSGPASIFGYQGSYTGQTGALTVGAGGSFNLAILLPQTNSTNQYWYITNSFGTLQIIDDTGTGGVTLARGASAWAPWSDERLKTDLVAIECGLSKVCSLRAVIGAFKNNTQLRQPFLIAQDVEKVLPEAVNEAEVDGDKRLTLAYTAVIPLLVSAIQELNAKVDAQALEIAALKGA